LSNLNNNANKKQAHPDMTSRMTISRRITIQKDHKLLLF